MTNPDRFKALVPGPGYYENLTRSNTVSRERPLSSKKSFCVKQTFNREKRDPGVVLQYSREYEHDLVNCEGPGPAAF